MNDIEPSPLPEHLKAKLIEIETQKATQNIKSDELKQSNKPEISKEVPSLIPEKTRNETLFRLRVN